MSLRVSRPRLNFFFLRFWWLRFLGDSRRLPPSLYVTSKESVESEREKKEEFFYFSSRSPLATSLKKNCESMLSRCVYRSISESFCYTGEVPHVRLYAKPGRESGMMLPIASEGRRSEHSTVEVGRR